MRIAFNRLHVQAVRQRDSLAPWQRIAGLVPGGGRVTGPQEMQTPPLGGKGPPKRPEIPHIAPRESSRFLAKPVKPFAASSTHPLGRAGKAASQKIDGSADAG